MARRQVIVPLSRAEALELARDAIENCDIRLRNIHETPSGLRGATGASFRSFGSKISVTATDDPNGTKLTIIVGPAAALVDWGRSDEEAQEIVSEIHRMVRGGR